MEIPEVALSAEWRNKLLDKINWFESKFAKNKGQIYCAFKLWGLKLTKLIHDLS